MTFQIRRAERRKAKARIGIAGVAGSGKTLSSLLIAYGIAGDWDKVGMIDTENGSGELYVGTTVGGVTIGQYLYGRIEAPFTPQKYIEAIKALEQAGVDVIIIDSLSHAWAGEGGLLDVHGKEADRSGNSWSAWRKVTPQHNQLVEAMLQSRCHIIATMRAKTEYAQVEDDRGKAKVKKLGMAPIQRDGMEYEFTVMLDIDINHVATASKDRTGLFDQQYFTPTADTGRKLLAWLETGTDAPAPEEQTAEPYCTPEDYKALVETAEANGWAIQNVNAWMRRQGYTSIRQVPASVLGQAMAYFSRPAEEATADANGADGADQADGARA